MDKSYTNIVMIEPSDIVYEGLTNSLKKSSEDFFIYRVEEINELLPFCKKGKVDAIIVNPTLLINKENNYVKMKKNCPNICCLGMIYTYFVDEIISKFDETLNINDSTDLIINKINKNIHKCSCGMLQKQALTEREIEVLALLAKGYANKSIADDLNISIHTVMSHRKNIIEKTGIKTLPGLTIYALTKKIIPFEQ